MRLIKEISLAKDMTWTAGSPAVSGHVRDIVDAARRACLRESDMGGYLTRIESLLRKFSAGYPECDNIFLIRAPGRVNLIGEHTDYNGLPVLPIAINRDILLAGSPRDDNLVEIHNESHLFSARRFEIVERIPPYPPGDWGNYAKAAAQAVRQFFAGAQTVLNGFNAVVDGNIPAASGLASSSALVVALALACLHANGLSLEPTALADLLAEGEQYVGTRGGGMDQAVCLMGRENHALKIDFFPIRTQHIPLPADCSFVICRSMVTAPKSAATRFSYNLRAAECRMAAAVVRRTLVRMKQVTVPGIDRLGDLYSKEAGLSAADIDQVVREALQKGSYTLPEIACLLGTDEQDIRKTCLSAFSNEEVKLIGKLKLLNRCRHVLSEGMRVRHAAEALRHGDMQEFGRLMYESHESCASDYEVSIPALDALVDIAREAGALGSRLTGAGFGGCTVSVVRNVELERFLGFVQKRFYDSYRAQKSARRESLTLERMFICRAVAGAGRFFA